MKKSYRLYITGSLQPVFFYQFIKNHADSLDIKGFIRKLEDGRMEIFIEGNKENVEKMLPHCRSGPPHSLVRNIEEKEERFQDFKEFRVLKF